MSVFLNQCLIPHNIILHLRHLIQGCHDLGVMSVSFPLIVFCDHLILPLHGAAELLGVTYFYAKILIRWWSLGVESGQQCRGQYVERQLTSSSAGGQQPEIILDMREIKLKLHGFD